MTDSLPILSEEQAWALGKGRVDFQVLPNWLDVELVRSIGFELDTFSSADESSDFKLRFGLVNSLGFVSRATRVGYDEYICAIPVGLVIRLDYLIRLLEPHANKEKVHRIDPDFYGDLPDPLQRARDKRRPPWPVDCLADPKVPEDMFWQAIHEIDTNDRNRGQSPYRDVQVDQLRQSILFCAFHEAAHVLRNHFKIKGSSDSELIDRKLELDADARAGRWLATYRSKEISSYTHSCPKQIYDVGPTGV